MKLAQKVLSMGEGKDLSNEVASGPSMKRSADKLKKAGIKFKINVVKDNPKVADFESLLVSSDDHKKAREVLER